MEFLIVPKKAIIDTVEAENAEKAMEIINMVVNNDLSEYFEAVPSKELVFKG